MHNRFDDREVTCDLGDNPVHGSSEQKTARTAL